ncbi:hypothetical protein CARUB_v10002586mg [Capsella rubella]|uniref:Uncharacterized protein n=1 Tax=Capsella rubella TaxID=81985 RepID=R0H4G3_9BRAS|nr:uncharacterized protein PB18E9.04c [Capsella rubella]EOA19565.1 hypothetical protein CARUB_v10002586mg [Capsella rubella]
MSSQQCPLRRTAADNFLYSEDEKSDYEWLVTPPGSPTSSVTNQLESPYADRMTLITRLESYSREESENVPSKTQKTSLHSSSSVYGIRRPSSSSSSRSTSRPSSPPRKSTPAAKRPSTPTSCATSTSARATLTSSSATNSYRSTTRPSSSSGTSSSARSATSTGQQTTCSDTSTRSNNRPMSAPNSKPGSRSSTPTRRPPTPTGSSTVLRSKAIKPVSKPAMSQGASPIVRSRPWEPYEMPGFSLEAPSNLRTTLPDRPKTASSSRTRAFGASNSSRSASIEREVARRQSCSPSRSRVPNGNANGAVPSLRGRRAKTKNDDGGMISHVATGNQKVERVVNVRKLAPPRQTESSGRGLSGGGGGSSAGKSSSGSDGFGFGRNLSKSSIDMALRHMDVRRRGSMAGNFRPSVTKVPATSLYSMTSYRNRPVSSSGSSESSVNVLCLEGSDDNLSDISYS